ncbi:hypothetical protein FDR95_05930 [Rhizobiaceae bacterium LC148]|nr:hypothetical protein FDR95_05930 [Rhizobiaceae bacterium LC148]
MDFVRGKHAQERRRGRQARDLVQSVRKPWTEPNGRSSTSPPKIRRLPKMSDQLPMFILQSLVVFTLVGALFIRA